MTNMDSANDFRVEGAGDGGSEDLGVASDVW
jgi:hypothetical protein